MSQAEELLNTLSAGSDTGVEGHIVIDSNRNITVPKELRRIAVQYDHNVETVTFDCPRYWDGLDMSKMTIYVNYIRADRGRGQFECKNITVDDADSTIMHFDWTLTKVATMVKGPLKFLVCVVKTDTDGNEEHHWNSELCDQMHISEGLETGPAVLEMHADIITDLLVRMDKILIANFPILDTGLTQRGLAADAKATGDAITQVRGEALSELNDLSRDLRTETTERKTEIAVERKRIDKFVALEKGSTTGDAELQDARIDHVGGVWNTAGNNIREAAALSDMILGSVMFNVEKIDTTIINGWVNVSGEYISNASSGDTHKCVQINVTPGEHYLIYSEYGWDMPDAVAQKVDGTMVNVFHTSDGARAINDFNQIITISDGVDKLTVNCMSENSKPLTVAKILSSTSRITDDYIANAISSVKDTSPILGVNLITDVSIAYAMRAGAVFMVESGDSQYTLGECEVTPGKTYIIKAGASFTCNPYIFFDKNGIPLGDLVTAPSSDYQQYSLEIVAPPQAAVLKVAQYQNAWPEVYEIKGYTSGKEWADLTWVCVGDSLTEKNIRTTKHYHDYISEDTGISIINMGVGGTGYKRGEENSNAFYQRIANVPYNADVVTIFGSGNDLSLYDRVGTVTDTSTDTICGCINRTIDILYSINPVMQIGIITPTPWINYPTTTAGNNMEKYAEILVEICRRRSIPCLDLYHCSGLRPWDETFRDYAYSKDDGNGVHPDETGHKIIAPRIKNFIRNLLI